MKTKNKTNRIVLFGSGRWARIIVETLNKILDSSYEVIVFSRHNFAELESWAQSERFATSILVKMGWPDQGELDGAPVIIANGARDHLEAGLFCLNEGSAVLIEKPMVLNGEDALQLLSFAENCRGMLAPAFVFMFADYLSIFRDSFVCRSTPQTINITWSDLKTPTKRYDSSIPIFKDVLPHMISILELIYPTTELSVKSVNTKRGGAQVTIDLSATNLNVTLFMERDGEARSRILEVIDREGICHKLDFTNEPATIYDGRDQVQTTVFTKNKKRPLELQLEAFLNWALGGEKDPRLDLAIITESYKLMDQVAPLYNSAQDQWLVDRRLNLGEKTCNDVKYALIERFQKMGRLSDKKIELALKKHK